MKKSLEEDNIEELQLEGELPSDIDPRMKLSPCDFMCEDCGLCNSNLWLNLSDGKILCGRKYREGLDLIRPLFLAPAGHQERIRSRSNSRRGHLPSSLRGYPTSVIMTRTEKRTLEFQEGSSFLKQVDKIHDRYSLY